MLQWSDLFLTVAPLDQTTQVEVRTWAPSLHPAGRSPHDRSLLPSQTTRSTTNMGVWMNTVSSDTARWSSAL